jgi:hypothetical protein
VCSDTTGWNQWPSPTTSNVSSTAQYRAEDTVTVQLLVLHENETDHLREVILKSKKQTMGG